MIATNIFLGSRKSYTKFDHYLCIDFYAEKIKLLDSITLAKMPTHFSGPMGRIDRNRKDSLCPMNMRSELHQYNIMYL